MLRISSGTPAAYSEISVSETYESTTSSPAAVIAVWKSRRCQRSGDSTIKAMSALWPSIETEMTWSPAAWAFPTTSATAALSTFGVALQKRWTTPRPSDGDTGSLIVERLLGAVEIEHSVAGKAG